MTPTPNPYCQRRAAAIARGDAAMASLMTPHLLAALDAADVAPDSAAGRFVLAAASDAGHLVRELECRRGSALDRDAVAADLVLLATRETARGVRVAGR